MFKSFQAAAGPRELSRSGKGDEVFSSAVKCNANKMPHPLTDL